MADLALIRQAIATALSTNIPNMTASPTVPDSVEVTANPIAFVGLPTQLHADIVEFDATFGNGTSVWHLVAKVIVAPWDQGRAQAKLDPFLGNDPANTSSVYQAIKKDHTLGGVVSSARVIRARRYGPHKVGDIPYLGADFEIEIISSP